jgi:hypothetical protein
VQFGGGALPEFSQSLLLTNALEDEDDDEYENEVPHENARKRSWKRWAASAAVRGEQ